MQIEEGKFYKTRDGRKVGPAKPTGMEYPWNVPWGCCGYYAYTSSGDSCLNISKDDLIAEWTDAPQYETGRWYPWTGGECPVDKYATVSIMMRDGEQVYNTIVCSWEWGHGDDGDIIAFRVDAYPEQEERVDCMRYGLGDDDPIEQGTCIKRDGVIDWSTWEDK